ncbi:hypothetical protein Ahy_A08g040651 isoform C [Arachis hypogaea]|nr:hypothetical protein Ahy_A08g040651 isoform C [Arachis hypogaea]
MESFSIR